MGVALFESSLTDAILISGSHPEIHVGQSDRLSDEVSRITRSHSQSIHTHRTSFNFLEAEELGIQQLRRCTRCKNCCRCKEEAVSLSRTESAEIAIIEESVYLVLDEPHRQTGKLTMSYPTKGDLVLLKENRPQAIGFQTGVNARLDRDGGRLK